MGAYGGSSEAAPTLRCRADFEGNDQDVDGADLVVFMRAYGTSSGNANYNPAADFNNDGSSTASIFSGSPKNSAAPIARTARNVWEYQPAKTQVAERCTILLRNEMSLLWERLPETIAPRQDAAPAGEIQFH